MTPARWQQVSMLFEAAVELPEADRDAYLSAHCGSDRELREELQRMLSSANNATQELDAIVSQLPPPSDSMEFLKGMRIGPYQLESEVGRGGMGTVWRAHRVDGGFEQTVAIKFIKRGMDTDEVLRRFTLERQILSLLDHPNIARIQDGGATDDGRPYLVMEYVEGRPLLQDCEARALGEPERLELFLTVCEAVQHAHSHLVIHRDLKPANIFIRPQGDVKLLDFGIAKLLEADDLQTVTEMRMLTPAFASPEQHAGFPISTATDIFSLGRILAELISGKPHRDLNAIIARATRPEAGQRYSTAGQFAEDIRRYLKGHPVEARSGVFAYRAARFLNRYAVAVIAALVLFAATIGIAVYVAVQKRNVEIERDRAENVSRFLRELFSSADPEHNQGNRISTRDMLDLGAARVRSITDPGSRLPLLDTMAEAYFNLGLYEKSVGLYRELVESEEKIGLPDRGRIAKAWGTIAEAEAFRGRYQEAEAAGSTAMQMTSRISNGDAAIVLKHRCSQLNLMTKYKEAVPTCQQAVRLGKASSLSVTERSGISMSLGNALMNSSQFAAAEAAFQDSLQLAKQSNVEPNNYAASQAIASLGSLYFRQGRFADAEKFFRDGIEFKRKLYPDGHLELARGLNNLANTLVTVKRVDEAIPIYAEAHSLYRKFLGEESSELATSMSNLAMTYRQMGRFEEAKTICAQVMDMQARTIGEGKLPHIGSQMKYATVLIEMGKAQEGLRVLESAMVAINRLEPIPKLEAGYMRVLMSAGLMESGRGERAALLASESKEMLGSILRPDHWMMQQCDIVLGAALVRSGKVKEGRDVLLPILALNEKEGRKGYWVQFARRYSADAPAALAGRK